MKASMPKRYDVETQSGIREKPEWCQTELELRKASKVFDTEVDATMWPDMRDYVLETESVPEVELVAPMQHARPPIKVDDKGMQTFIRSTTYDVEVQSGLIEYSRGMQTDLASMVVSGKKYDVAVQLGICSRAELCQTDMEFKTKAQVCDAEVDASMLHVRSDYVLETESPPELELVAPMQHTQPATQTDDKGVQAFTRSVLYDVEVQSGLVDHTQGVQTEAQSAAVALRKFDVELQSGIRDKSEWCQTDVGYRPVVETQDAEVDAALDTASRDYTLETDALLEVQVAQPVLASRAYIDKEDIGLQAAMVPARFDVELQSGVTTAEGKTQVDELLKPEVSVSNRSVQTAVESVSPVFNKKLQVCLSPIPVDAILQSDDAVVKDLSATVQREPLKKVDIGLQTVVSDRTEWCQADLGLRTKVEVMDVGVDASMRHVRSDYLFETESLPAVELVAPIQHAGPPTQTDDKSMQAFIRAATFDVIAQSGLVSTSRGAQTDAAPMAVLAKKFDVETQSGICSKAELCQTDMEFKTKAQVRDAEVDASMLHIRNDYVLETESSPELELVAPMQHAQPATQADDKGVQAFTRSVLYDVEVQSGIIDYSRGVQTEAQSAAVALRKFDVELQSGIRDKSEWCQTDVGYRPVVETQDAEVDAALDTASRDYTLETDALLEVQVAQPVLASRAYIDKEDIGLQAAMVPARFDVELQSGVTTAEGKTQVDELLKPEVSVSNRSVQTAVESVSPVFNKKLQVCLSPIPVDAILQSDDAVVKDLSATVQREPLKKVDIGLQTVVSDRTECCQVDLGLRTKVEVMDVGVDASMRHVRSDYLFETESLPAVELVAPIQHAGPPTQTDDKCMQAFIRAATFDVIAQSGLVSTSRGAQTDAAPMAVLAKKFDVETQSGICSKAELCQTDMELRAMKDYALETDSLPEVELVAPIEHAPPPIQVDDKCIQAVGGVVLYDAELQSGVTTSIGVTQVDEFLKPKVSVSGRSVQTDDQSPLSVLNKKLQVRLNPIPFDVTVQSDDVPMMDFSALVQQAALKKFDVEAQAGLMYTSECSQTDMVFKSKVDVLDAEVDACMRPAMGDYVLETDSLPEIELVTPVQLARPPAQLDDKSVQVSSRAVVYDVELQAGVTTSNSVTQVDDDLLRLQVPISGRSVQTDVESAVLPVVNKKLQVCINPIPVDSTFDAIEDFRSGYGAGLSRVPRIDVGLQCAISPRLFDVELQSGSTQSTVASQTEADRYVSSAVAFGVEPVSSFAIPVDCVLTTDAPPDPIVIPSIQSSTSRPALSAVNKKLQVSLDHHLQVSSINQASQCEEVAKHPVINSNIQVNLRSERSEASTQFVDMLEKAQAPVQSARISTSTSVAVQCDRRQSYRDASTHSELFAISKGELQHMEAKPIVEMTTKASHYYGDTTRIPVPTQVTTVSYQSVQPIPSHSSQRLVDAYCEVMYPTSVIQVTTQSQALSQPRESTIITLAKTATSYVQPHSAEFISATPISSAPKAPILVDSNFGFTHTQKNKKCQINLLDGSSARSQMLNKKLQTQVRQEDASCECMLVDSRSSPITPAGQTEAQVQATPYSLNKKLQVKIQPTTTVSATLTECASVEVRLQPVGSRVSTRDAGVMSEPLGAQQVWTQCAEVFEPTSVPLIKAEAGHVKEVLDMPIARSEAPAETLAALEPVVSRGRVHAMLEKTPAPTVTQLVTKGSSFQSERLETAHKMFSPLYTQTQLQLEVPRSDEWSQTVGAEPELESIRRSPVPQTRHVRIQKGSSWLVSRQQDVEVQASPLTSTEVEIRLTDLIQGAPRIDVPDSGEAGVTKPHGSRPSSTTSPTGSIRGLRYPRQEAVNWGVQCTPLTLNGVTQTSDLTRTESGSDISDHSTTAVRRPKHYGGTSVGLQTSFDDEYTIKRVVTTIARRGNVSVHKRSTPVVRYMHARGRPSLLTTSLPSHLDEQLLAGAEDDESEDGYETPTTAKVTTFSVDGERRVVRDDLHFGPRGRGRSLDSRLGPHSHLGGSDMYESDLADMHDEIHMQSQAEMYFDKLLRTWGAPYLLSRLSRRGSAMSVDRDVNGTDGSRLARLIGVKTQYTSTGNLAAYHQGGGNTRTTETQTAGLLPQGRPPHRNKRIQRGQSYISWTPGQAPVPVAEISPTVGESPLGYTQQHATPSFGFSSTYTETIRERVATCGRMDDYVCPNCGYHAHLPQYRPGSMSTVQPLPITQLRNVTCQTAEMGVDAIDPVGQTLPIYITDEDLMHINPRQHFSEDQLLSKVTWCEAGGSLKVGDSSSSSHLVDEVWIDSPGKLLEVHTTGVVIPGSDRVISAAEAFYRGILRVVYWDYTKAAPSSMLLAESGIVTPIADAVVADLVRLACYSPERVMMGKTDRSALSINTHVVWTTPEKHRTRYAVHAVRPEGERQGASYSVASAFAAGYIRKDDGQLALRHPMYADVGYETGVQSLYSDTVEKISVQEAIVRGILDVELIATDSPSVRAQMTAYEKTPYRSDYSPHDVDV
ncbi:unnamed protein product [Dicrocoelium dendriticum]|nr:unnamed protein product [Dicrocoelium dendriticum]